MRRHHRGRLQIRNSLRRVVYFFACLILRPGSAHQHLRLAFKRIAQVDDASSGLLRRMPMLARHLFTARKEDEIDADKRTRLDPLNERHFVTNGFELAQCNVVVHQQKISGAEGRFAQSVVQFLAAQRGGAYDCDLVCIWHQIVGPVEDRGSLRARRHEYATRARIPENMYISAIRISTYCEKKTNA